MKNRFIKQSASAKNKKQVSIFITAGFPKLESTTEQILFLQEKGVDFIEVGIPFSDPMADGETIQKSSSIALANGMNLEILFKQLVSIQNKVKIPLVLMGYLNPVLQFGLERFLVKCNELKISELIIPDISFEIYQFKYKELFEKYKIELCFLITPKTSNERIKLISQNCKNGFIYLVSQNTTTGQENSKADLSKRYQEIKSLCKDVPLMMGFGISDKNGIQKAHEHCNGAIIGSAYLKAVENNTSESFIESLGLNTTLKELNIITTDEVRRVEKT
ncbi:MAG: tryptophan synthase subunit alpha [Bacteroidota bacterium]